MNLRIKFSKHGCMKFIGHLDMMRYFQKAIRRADIDIAYTAGFSPHQIMSFAAPLGVGLESDGEYMDIRVHSAESSTALKERLNRVMVEGIQILSVRSLPEGSKNAMSVVAGADYLIRFSDSCPEGFADFMDQPSLIVEKKTKKQVTELDIRPLIFDFSVNQYTLCLKLSAGSVNNLKPELVVQTFFDWNGKEWDPAACQITRLEIYGRKEDGTLCALEEFGEEIG